MRYLVFIWWFAVVDPTGVATYFEYVLHRDCKSMERLMNRVQTLKVTTCQWR